MPLMCHLRLLCFPGSLIVFDVNELLECMHLQVHLCPQLAPDLLSLIPEVLVEVELAKSLVELAVHILEESTALGADVVKYRVLKVALIRLDNPVRQLFLDELADSVVASLVVDYGRLVDLEDIHERLQSLLILALQTMLVELLMVV